MSGRRLLIATTSEGKLRELRPMLAPLGFELVSLAQTRVPIAPDAEVETFDSFEENARAKAEYYNSLSGLPAVADDSGLEVAALGGAPGVRSKRWSAKVNLEGQALDDANNAILVESLEGVSDLSARYVCVAAYADGTRILTARGESAGEIVLSPRGTRGFGYDPYFFSPALGKTFGEATAEEKAGISHRGRAFRALSEQLAATSASR